MVDLVIPDEFKIEEETTSEFVIPDEFKIPELQEEEENFLPSEDPSIEKMAGALATEIAIAETGVRTHRICCRSTVCWCSRFARSTKNYKP